MIWESIAGLVKGLADSAIGIIDQFTISPEEKMKMKMAMQETAMSFQREMWKLETSDRDSARKREVETNDPTVRRLAYVYTGGYFGLLSCLMFGAFTITSEIKQLVDVLMAVLTAGQYSVLAYYFGSSHGSASKDKTLDRVMNHKG